MRRGEQGFILCFIFTIGNCLEPRGHSYQPKKVSGLQTWQGLAIINIDNEAVRLCLSAKSPTYAVAIRNCRYSWLLSTPRRVINSPQPKTPLTLWRFCGLMSTFVQLHFLFFFSLLVSETSLTRPVSRMCYFVEVRCLVAPSLGRRSRSRTTRRRNRRPVVPLPI